MTASQARESGATEGGLRGSVSERLLLLLVVGDILGAGIYVLIGELAGEVGGLTWAAFAGAFLIAITSATSYAELVTRYPGAAGSALYARKAFNSPTVTAMVGLAVLASTLATSATNSGVSSRRRARRPGCHHGVWNSSPTTSMRCGGV